MRMETLLNLDGGLLLAIQELHQPWLDPIVSGFTKLGDMGLLWIVLSLGMLCWRPTRKAGALALAALVLGSLCTNVFLKHLVARPRPWALPGRWRWFALVLAVCMGLSRLYVGVHYPSDVLAGAAVGTLCAWAVRRMYCPREGMVRKH